MFCALAIAEELRSCFPATDILLVDADGDATRAVARRAGLPVESLAVSGIARGPGILKVARNLALPLKVFLSLGQARAILDRFQPDVVVGVGGYASGPMVVVAARAGIPTLIHEANVRPGVTNALLAREVSLVSLGFAQAGAAFPVGRTLFTGNPIRSDVSTALVPGVARSAFGLAPQRKTVLVTGGSLGARRLNAWVLRYWSRLVARGVQVLWQCGPAHLSACIARLTRADGVRLVPFVDDMAAAYAAADLVVTSAGALVLAELAALGKPAILVPDRDASEDHQRENALELQRQGVAVCHVGHTAGDTGDTLFDLVASVIDDPDRRRALGVRIARLGQPDAGARIVAQVARLAGLAAAGPIVTPDRRAIP